MVLFAVHLLDGFLPLLPWCLAGYVVAIALAALGSFRLHERDIPRIALATAAFFVASSIHIYIPPSPASVHLVLNGLVGIVLGFRAGLALLVGLFLQAVLMRHGGIYTLGINVALQAIPALVVGELFRALARVNSLKKTSLAIGGGLLAAVAVLATVALQSSFLLLAGYDGPMPALLWFALHVPVMFVEGIVVGFMVHFLARVKPELLGLRATQPSAHQTRNEFANSVLATDENVIK